MNPDPLCLDRVADAQEDCYEVALEEFPRRETYHFHLEAQRRLASDHRFNPGSFPFYDMP